MKLFASLQCTDAGSAQESAREYARLGFDGVAIGEMAPRLKDIKSVLEIIATVRAEVGDEMPIHVFGVGKPELLSGIWGRGRSVRFLELCETRCR
jgi:tRNA-guanine family transglycosylase